MVCKRGQDLPFHVLANDTYENSIAYARLHAGTETNADRSSLNRFCAADRRVNDFRPGSENENVQYAFDALDRISQGDFTVWSIVYEISKRRIQYRTRSNHQIRSIDFSALDFSCGGPVLFRDIEDDPAKNNGPEFEVLTKEKQRGYLENLISGASMKQKFGDLRPQVFGQLKMLDDFHCQQNHQEASQQSGGRMEDHSTK